MKSFERVIELDGDSPGPWFALSEAATQAERWDAALAAVDKTLELFAPTDSSRAQHADAHCARGKILERLKRQPEAIEAYLAALRLDPEHPEALDRNRRLNRGQR